MDITAVYYSASCIGGIETGVPNFDRYLSKESIELVSQDQWYAESGRFELAAVIERFRGKL
jgi:hypothetical protein